MTSEIVKKKYDTTYLGKSYFGHIAYDNKKPIAFHGAIPVEMKYANKYEIAAQYGDAMTLPEYAGNGLFTKLGKLTDEQLKKFDIKFVWGFPNQNSEYGYLNKLDWKYEERMEGFKIKTSVLPFEKIMKKTNFTTSLYENHITQILEKYKIDEQIKGSVYNSDTVVSTARNKAYYDYKSFNNNFTIKIKDVLFWIKIKNGLLVGDIETPSKESFYIALKELKKIASKNGIGEIIFQSSPGTLISRYIKDNSDEQFESWCVGYKNFNSEFPLEKLQFTFGDLDTF